MPQDLDVVYANVRDLPYLAKADGATDDSYRIQHAINSGQHLLFPAGELDDAGNPKPYVIARAFSFNNPNQRFLFQAGAYLELKSNAATITINAPGQTFEGLWIHGGTDSTAPVAPNPCLQITGADGLLLKDPRVECGSATTLVAIKDTAGVTIEGGQIYGVTKLNLNTGLDLQDGTRDFTATALTIHQLAHGVVFNGTKENISFVDCDIEAEWKNMIEVRGHVHGLSLTGVHMESGTREQRQGRTFATRAGAFRFIVVNEGGGVHGGYVTACEFGAVGPPPVGQGRRVFVVHGEWIGVNVAGCYHNGGNTVADAHAVWEIASTATVSRSAQAFNHFDSVALFAGDRVLPTFTNDTTVGLTLSGPGIRITAKKIGFFGATPVGRKPKYRVGPSYSRNLQTGGVYLVLGALLRDLAALGLIECEISPVPPR